MRFLIIILLIPIFSYSQPIEAFIDSSNLIIEGRVISRHETDYKNGWNRYAKVEIIKIFKGEYSTSTIDIVYHEQQFHTRISFTAKEHFIAFLNVTDSVVETIHNHNGKFDFRTEITEDFSIFLSAYLQSESKEEELEVLLANINKGPEFSTISLDILIHKKLLDKQQQHYILEVLCLKTMELIKSIPGQKNRYLFYQGYDDNYYDFLYYTLKNRKIRKQAIELLNYRLTFITSAKIVENTLWIMSRISTKNRFKMRVKFKKYEKEKEYEINRNDEINAELYSLIEYFKN